MGKEIFYDKNALKELCQFSDEIQKDFQAYIAILASEGRLEFPDARKVTKELFEIRIAQDGGIQRFLRISYGTVHRNTPFLSKEDPEDAIEKYQISAAEAQTI